MTTDLIPCEDVSVKAGMTKYYTTRGESMDELMFHLALGGVKTDEISIQAA